PRLRERLQPAFAAVDRYILRLGNVRDVFDSEFRFFASAPEDVRQEADRLASLIGNIGEASEDVQLACLVVFLFATVVEGEENALRGNRWEEDHSLRVRIYLLADYIREERRAYASA